MFTTKSQLCLNCEYWDGERAVSRGFRSQAESSSQNEKGKCLFPKGGYKNLPRKASEKLGCPEFVKWNELK